MRNRRERKRKKRVLEAVRQRESDGIPDNVTQMRGLRERRGNG